MTNSNSRYVGLALVLLSAACTVTDTPAPPLTGPSEMSLSLAISASPDVLSLDGSSQSLIAIEARDTNGQLAANVPLRVEIEADGEPVDYGSISARTLVTGSNGRATVTYTAPRFVGETASSVELAVTPTGSDASAHVARKVRIRLVPPGLIGTLPRAVFSFSPSTPAAFTTVRFDGSASTGGLGANVTHYQWNFGDGDSATGVTASHEYEAAGTYNVTLTVTDSNGLSGTSTPQEIRVGEPSVPRADFVFSPSAPIPGQSIFFNGAISTPGGGHRLVRYEWDFGTGAQATGSTATHTYSAPGTYAVVLTVTDDVGQIGRITKSVTVGVATPTAVFSFSPTNPTIGTAVNFNGTASTAPSGSTIVTWAWDFGDGSTGSGSTVQRTYASASTFTVRLTVTDSSGRTATSTQNVTVQ